MLLYACGLVFFSFNSMAGIYRYYQATKKDWDSEKEEKIARLQLRIGKNLG